MTDIKTTQFDIVFAATKSADSADATPKIIGTASSDQIDLGDDRFALSALRQMAKGFPGKTLFLNHVYTVPESVAGQILTAEIVQRGTPAHHELSITASIDSSNPRAMQAYQQILSGLVLGISVGVLVDAASFVDDKASGKKIMEITSIRPLEASLCGIPSNSQSWVSGALKAASYVLTDKEAPATPEDLEAPPVSTEEAQVWQWIARVYQLQARIATHERDEFRQASAELLSLIRHANQQLLPRKAVLWPEDTDRRLDALARYGLTPEVISLAKSTPATAPRKAGR